jgi:hypothetical protein
LLLETELWYRRGFLDNPHVFPKEIFDVVPLREFIAGGLKSPRRWMMKVVYGNRVFRELGSSRIERLVSEGTFPERLHSVRNWSVFDFDDLVRAIRFKAQHHPHWGVFATQYYCFYRQVLNDHTEAWHEIDAFIDACVRFPKRPEIRDLFERVYSFGGTLRATAKMKTLRQLRTHVDVLVEREETRPRRATIYEYRPPDVDLPPAWKWADKDSFWTLSELYNCCISRHGYYADALKNGRGAASYRPSFNCETDRGALSFFTRGPGLTWEMREIRGWSNSTVRDDYFQQAKKVAADLQRREEELEAERRRELERNKHESTYNGRRKTVV